MRGKVRERAETAGMINSDTGQLKGYIPEEFHIWIPPKKINQNGEQLDAVKLIESEHGAKLLFLVPFKCMGNVEEDESEVILNKRYDRSFRPPGASALESIGWTKKQVAIGLLDDFIELVSKANEQGIRRSYLSFAMKWGPLWKPDDFAKQKIDANNNYRGLSFAPLVESIEDWSNYALKIKTALIIAILLNEGNPVKEELWHDLYTIEDAEFKVPDRVEEQRKWFEVFFNMQTVIDYDVSYYLKWSNDKPKIGLRANTGFISALWFQLLQAVTMQSLTICNGCGKAYDREKRKPKKGQNNYCKNCRVTAPKNAWYDRNSEKVNEQRRLKRLKDISPVTED